MHYRLPKIDVNAEARRHLPHLQRFACLLGSLMKGSGLANTGTPQSMSVSIQLNLVANTHVSAGPGGLKCLSM
jgi:hypothetical protein